MSVGTGVNTYGSTNSREGRPVRSQKGGQLSGLESARSSKHNRS